MNTRGRSLSFRGIVSDGQSYVSKKRTQIINNKTIKQQNI